MFTLPKLNYEFSALEPAIDAKTMEIHYTKHHQAYLDKLNAALEQHPDLADQTVESLLENLNNLPADVRPAIINHGGGHYNHSLFWSILSPKPQNEPTGELKNQIDKTFGSLTEFKTLFETQTAGQFGSGWGWLAKDSEGVLKIVTTPNQNTPLSDGLTPILGVDVWEHAYYLNYQNRRPDYLKAIWQVIDWKAVENRYQS